MGTFRFSLGLAVADLLLTLVLMGTGVNVPSAFYFAPSIEGKMFLNALNSYRAAASSNLISIRVIYFFFYVVPTGLLFAVTNLLFGTLAGFPIMVYNIGLLMNAPFADIAAFMALAIIMQSITWVYLVDALIGWIFIGRTMDSEAGG